VTRADDSGYEITSMSKRRPSLVPTLGLPFASGLRVHDAPIHGANVAVSEAIEMIVRHSRFSRIRVFIGPDQERRPVEQWLGRIRPISEEGEPGLAIEHPAMLAHEPLGRLDAWHSVTGHGTQGRHLRSMTSARFPVTAVHHSFAANDQLHDWVLRFLLEDVRAYDSQIATSQSNVESFQRSLQHVKRALAGPLDRALPYRGRVDRIPLGVDTKIFRPRDKAEVRYELGLPRDELLVLWVGRLSAAGKADLVPALGAMAEVMQRTRRPMRLVVGGVDREGFGAVMEKHARNLGIAERLWLQTPVPPVQRHLWHAAADVFISPADSMQETFGLTCVEAMACGVPQLVSDWDGYRDTVVDGVTGYLVPTTWIDSDRDIGTMAPFGEWSRDHFALAQSVVVDMHVFRERLLTLVEDDELRLRLGRASRARAVEHYDWAAIVARYDDLWEELGSMARRAARERRRPLHYLVSRYVHTNRGNATRMIDTKARIVLSARGQRVVDGEEGLPEYFKRGRYQLDYDLIEDALVSLGSRGQTIEKIARAIAAERRVHHDKAVRHVVWLLKYDLARLVAT